MNMLMAIVWCSTLLLGSGVAGAEESLKEKEILEKEALRTGESAPAGSSQVRSINGGGQKAVPDDLSVWPGGPSPFPSVGVPEAPSRAPSEQPSAGLPDGRSARPSSPTGTPQPDAVEPHSVIRPPKPNVTMPKPTLSAPSPPPDKPLPSRTKERGLSLEPTASTPMPSTTLNRVDGRSQLPSPSSVAQPAPREMMAESDSVAQPHPPKVKPLANRFLDPPLEKVFNADRLSWDAADCGCVPALSTVETYGFYPFWDKNAVGPVNFGLWSRIGYYALTPDQAGQVKVPAGWMDSHGDKKAASVPHRYGTKVDLVIRNNKWAALSPEDENALALDTTYVSLELIDNVMDLVSRFGFDGVTIDFDFSDFERRLNETKESKYQRVKKQYVQNYLLFMKQLSKALKAQNSELRLHAVLQYDKDPSGTLLRLFTASELKELSDSVDLFLFIPRVSPSLGQAQAMAQYDDYFTEFSYGAAAPIEKKLVFVMDTEEAVLEKELADIRSDRFGGVGGWLPRKAIDAEITTKWADPVFVQSRGYVERLIPDVFPSPFCKLVCPNRSLFVAVIVALMAVYGGAFLLSFFSPIVEKVVTKHFRTVLLGALVIVVLIGSLVFCVPHWSMGWATELTLLFLLVVGGYAFSLMRIKKREATYP